MFPRPVATDTSPDSSVRGMIGGEGIGSFPTAGGRFLQACVALRALIVVFAPGAAAPVPPPFVPTDDRVVVATLRPEGLPAAERELRHLRQTLAAIPTNTALALDVARRCVERAREEADPRFLGHAQIALAPWWNEAAPPVDVLVLRATIRQSLHNFTDALADLDAAVARDPRHLQAWLTKTTVHTVRAEFPEARRSAAHLLGLADSLTATTAAAQVASLTGHAAPACSLLESVLSRSAGAQTGSWLWAQTLLAETYARIGRDGEAERHFRAALALAPGDPYLLGAYTDFLLEQRRPAEVVTLLRDHSRIDGLLLRLAEATAAQSQVEVEKPQVAELAARFAAARARGDRVHLREEARFVLRLGHDAPAALHLARENWRVQREPADARILLEAARAAGDRVSEAEVLAWVGETGLEDVTLRPAPMAQVKRDQ